MAIVLFDIFVGIIVFVGASAMGFEHGLSEQWFWILCLLVIAVWTHKLCMEDFWSEKRWGYVSNACAVTAMILIMM